MTGRGRARAVPLAALLLGGLIGAAVAGAPGERKEIWTGPRFPAAYEERGPARTALKDRCLMCHAEAIIASQRLAPAQWKAEVEKMQRFGAPLEKRSEEESLLLEHLSRTLAADAPRESPLRVSISSPQVALPSFGELVAPLPEADRARGASRFATACATCHGVAAAGSDKGPRLTGRTILADREAFARVIRAGRGIMPSLEGATDQEIADLLAFLRERTGSEGR